MKLNVQLVLYGRSSSWHDVEYLFGNVSCAEYTVAETVILLSGAVVCAGIVKKILCSSSQ